MIFELTTRSSTAVVGLPPGQSLVRSGQGSDCGGYLCSLPISSLPFFLLSLAIFLPSPQFDDLRLRPFAVHEITQRVGGVVAAVALFVHVDFQEVFGMGRVML